MVLPKRKCVVNGVNGVVPLKRKRNRSFSSISTKTPFLSPTLIVDNGAHTLKVGYLDQEPAIIPNCVMKVKSERRRAFIGNQISECPDLSGLYYQLPFQKGYLVNWDVQKTVWDYVFGEECLAVNFSETPILLTEPINNFKSIREATAEIFFEEYECQSLLRLTAPDLSEFRYRRKHSGNNQQCVLVVDAGYSFIHIVPYVKSQQIKNAIRRIDVGGKLLTNQLREVISYRQLNVMDETHVMNQCKEDCCYVSLNFNADLEKTRLKDKANTIVKDYVLPDYSKVKRGYMQEISNLDTSEMEQQVLRLNNERISIPEILFHPSDIGIEQKGIVEAIMDSVEACPEDMHSHLLQNIILTGGCAKFPNFRERIEKEIYTTRKIFYDVRVTGASNPITYAFYGGALLCQDPNFTHMFESREEYMEVGS